MERVLITIIFFLNTSFVLAKGKNKVTEVKVNVKAVYAYKNGKSFDTKLEDVKEYLLEAMGIKFSSFKLIKTNSFSLKKGEENSISYESYGKIKIKFTGIVKGYLTFKAFFKDLTINIKLADNGLFIQAGRKYKKGIIIFLIKAEKL